MLKTLLFLQTPASTRWCLAGAATWGHAEPTGEYVATRDVATRVAPRGTRVPTATRPPAEPAHPITLHQPESEWDVSAVPQPCDAEPHTTSTTTGPTTGTTSRSGPSLTLQGSQTYLLGIKFGNVVDIN